MRRGVVFENERAPPDIFHEAGTSRAAEAAAGAASRGMRASAGMARAALSAPARSPPSVGVIIAGLHPETGTAHASTSTTALFIGGEPQSSAKVQSTKRAKACPSYNSASCCLAPLRQFHIRSFLLETPSIYRYSDTVSANLTRYERALVGQVWRES